MPVGPGGGPYDDDIRFTSKKTNDTIKSVTREFANLAQETLLIYELAGGEKKLSLTGEQRRFLDSQVKLLVKLRGAEQAMLRLKLISFARGY